MFKLCVFDLDGTLVNSLEDLAYCTNIALEKFGLEKQPLDRFNKFVGDGVPMLIKRAMGDNFTEDLHKSLISEFNEQYKLHYADKTMPYSGVVDLLKTLIDNDVKIAVLSNKPDNFTKKIVSTIFKSITFSKVQGKLEGIPKKPDPTALNNLITEYSICKEETLYIGDSNVDVYTANNAGVKVCGVTWGFRGKNELKAAGADYIVDKANEIEKIVIG